MLAVYRMWMRFRVVVWFSGLRIDVNRLRSIRKCSFIEIIRAIFLISGRSTAVFLVEMLCSQPARIHLKPPVTMLSSSCVLLIASTLQTRQTDGRQV